MKLILTVAALAIAPAAGASFGEGDTAPIEVQDPTEDPEYQRILRLRAAYDEMVHRISSHEDYAGYQGEIYVPAMPRIFIDRRAEARKKPGNPPSRIEAIDSILKNVNAGARGQIKININRTYYDNGQLKSEEYMIDIGGNWNIGQGSMDEAKAKQHE